MIFSKIRIFIPMTLLVIFFVFTSSAFENKIYSVHFVDEEDVFVSAKYILNGEKLYSNLYTQHQPLSFLMSAQIQKYLKINSLPQLIKRHREFVILYSFFWSLVLVRFLGAWTLGFIIPLEVSKHYFYGNLFLSESLSLYPFIFLSLFILNEKQTLKNIKIRSFLIGFLTSFIALLLLTLWPALIFLVFLYLLRNKDNLKTVSVFLLTGFFPLIIYASQFISWKEYVFDVFVTTYKYYLAPLEQSGEKISLLGFIAPLLTFFWTSTRSLLLQVIQFLSLLYLMLSTLLILKKRFWVVLHSAVLLGFTHIRYVNLEKSFHNGFHLLPWFGLLMVFIFYFFRLLTKRNPKLKLLSVIYFIIIPLLIFLPTKNYFLLRTDRETDAYVNFSRPFDFGEAVRLTKSDNDRLFVVPDNYLIYWQADITHFDSTTSYYPWMESIPSMAKEINTLFATNPPEFFYCECTQMSLVKYLPLYNRVLKDNQETDLYILKTKSQNLSRSQWDGLKYYRFDITGRSNTL